MKDEDIDYHKLNQGKIVAYLQSGCKYTQSLGFELEHVLLHKDTGAPVSYSEPGGVDDVLKRLAPAYDRYSSSPDSRFSWRGRASRASSRPARCSVPPTAWACPT